MSNTKGGAVDILIYGITNSIILSLMSLGFALVYSISRLPNFAHGALYITAGYIVWLLINKAGLPYLPSVLLGLAATSLIGALIYRFIIMRIRGMEISEIIGTYAIGLAIIEGLRWGGLRGMTYTLPAFVAGSTEIGGVSIDYQRTHHYRIRDTDLHPPLFIHPIQQDRPGPARDRTG